MAITRHDHSRPGCYKVSVNAYVAHHGWLTFDTITVSNQPAIVDRLQP